MSPEPPAEPQIQANSKDQPTPTWLKRVPMITGVLAGLAGFLTVKSGNLSHQANYFSTQAVLHQERASDAWAEYQADSVKRHIDQIEVETGNISATEKATLTDEIKDLRNTRQSQTQATAHQEEALCNDDLAASDQRLSIKDMLDSYASVTTQLGIALASVAALTRKKSVFTVAVVIGLIAVVITAYALVEPMVVHLFHH
jgi:hypothetical protein